MRKLIMVVAALWMAGVCVVAHGQDAKWQAPDDEAIKVATADPASRFYYPLLMDRYLKGDTTLDAEDYRHLYYGFVFRPEYRPLDPLAGENELLMEFERGVDSLNAQRIVELAGVVMQSDPFDMTAVNLMTYGYNVLGDRTKEEQSASRLEGIFGAIAGSGDGETKDSPWHVIWFSHVNDFLAMKGYVPRSRTFVSISVEYVLLRDSDRRNRGLYFDMGRVYSKPPTVIPEKPKGIELVW